MTLAPPHTYRPAAKPRVRRVRWPGTNVWVWGLYRREWSPRPHMLAAEVRKLTEMLGRAEERKIVNLMKRLSQDEAIHRQPTKLLVKGVEREAAQRILRSLPKDPAPE